MTDANDVLLPPLPAYERGVDESTTLVQMLDYYRAVLARKGSGLTTEQLGVSVAASDLTIAGLIYHMAYVEDIWFHERFLGEDKLEPWASADWDSDFDWEMTHARTLAPNVLFARYNESIERSRAIYAASHSLDQLAAADSPDGSPINLRWIMVHMIEEYARHCGHADLIRQSIDGTVDD